jgi:hypothetical protein
MAEAVAVPAVALRLPITFSNLRGSLQVQFPVTSRQLPAKTSPAFTGDWQLGAGNCLFPQIVKADLLLHQLLARGQIIGDIAKQ